MAETTQRTDCVIAGYRFVNLSRTLAWKRALARSKDLADVALIEEHLRSDELT